MDLGRVDHHLGESFEITENPILFQSKNIAMSNKKYKYFNVKHGNFIDTYAISRKALNQISLIFNKTHQNIQSDPYILRKGLFISIVQFVISFSYPEPFERSQIDRQAAGQIYLSKIRFLFIFACVFLAHL